MRHALRGPNLSTSTACASGAHAIGEAVRLLRSRQCSIVVAGAVVRDGHLFSWYNPLVRCFCVCLLAAAHPSQCASTLHAWLTWGCHQWSSSK